MKMNRLILRTFRKNKQRAAQSRKPSVLAGSIAVLAASVLSLIAPASRAAVLTWDVVPGAVGVGDGVITDGSGIWNTTNGNWTADGGVNNVAFTTLDDVTFGGGAAGAFGLVALGQNISANSLTFNTTFGGGAYTISGGNGNFSLTVAAAGIAMNNAGGANISANVVTSAGQSWTNNSAGLLNVSGNVATTGLLTILNTSTGGTTLSGIVSGTTGITVNSSGTGATTLSGFSTYSGATTLAAGRLNINNGGNSATNSALGTSALTIAGGSIDNTSGRLVVMQTNNAQNWNADFTYAGSGFLNLGTGGVVLGADRIVTVNANTLVVGGAISATAFKVTKQGTGALTLSGVNLNTGGYQLDAGQLNVNGVSALGPVGGTFTITGGTLDNTSGAGITLVANQPVALNGDFTYAGDAALSLGTGGTTLNANRIITVNANSSVLANSSLTIGGVIAANAFNLTKNGQGNLTLTAANLFGGVGNTVTLNAGTLTMGNAASLGDAANNLIINGGQLDASAAITTSAYPQNWNGDFRFVGSNATTLAGTVTLGSTRQVTVNASTLTVSGAINGATFGLTKAGAGAMTLTGNSAAGFDGGVIVNGGALQLNAQTGSLNPANTLAFTGTSSFTYANIFVAGAKTQVLASAAFSAGDGSLTLNRSVSQNLFLDFGGTAARSAGGVALFGINGAAAAPTNVNNGTAGNIRISFATQPAGVMGAGYFASSTTAAPVGVYNLAFYDSANGGFVREINYASDTNAISQSGGDLLVNAGKEVRTTGAATTLSASANLNSLNINGATPTTVILGAGTTLTLGGTGIGVLLKNGSTTNTTISGGLGITAGTAGAQELIIRSDAAAETLTLLTPITAATGNVTKSGLGALTFGATGLTGVAGSNAFTGNFFINAGTVTAVGANSMNSSLAAQTVTLNGGATLNLRADGDASDALQTVVFGDNYNITGAGTATITVDQQGLGQAGGTTFLTTANKTLQLGNLTIGNTTLAVTASNGFGLEFNGATALSSTPTFNVTSAATASNVVQGLTLSGVVSGTTTGLGITKSGTGSLSLTNASNSFIGNITVSGGILSFTSNGALGDLGNQISLNGTTATLRAVGGAPASPIQTARTINFASTAQANNVIEVPAGNALQINVPFGLANNAWTKLDAGLLILNADNSTQSKAIQVSGGALRVLTSNSIGFSTVTVGNAGSSFQLDGSGGNITLNNAFTIGTAGVGTIYNIAGNNTLNGTITGNTGPTLIGDAGSSLNLNNPTAFTGAFALGFGGAGTFNINGTTGTATAINLTRFQNGAAPVVNLNVADTTLPATATVGIQGGTLTLGGTSTGLGSFPAAGAGVITVAAGGVLTVNDSNGTATVATRLGGTRPVSLSASTLNYIGGGAGLPAPWTSSETSTAALTAGAGNDTVSVTGGTLANPATLTFSGLAANVVNVGGFLQLQGVDAAGTTNRFVLTTAPTLIGPAATTQAVMARAAIVSGTTANLVTQSAAGQPLLPATYTAVAALADINNTVGATGPGGTFTATNNAQLASGSHQIEGLLGTNTATINALVMSSGVATTLTGTAGTLLAVTSGNILVANNTAAIFGNTGSPGNGIILAQGTVPTTFMVNTGSSLELAATITSGANTGLQKALAGSLNITGKQFFTSGTGFFDITGGSVKLSAGDHTLAAQQVNIGMDPTATLDLNGTVLEANAFSSSNISATVGSGGLVINSSGTQATLVNRGISTFGGQVTGNIFVGHSQATTLTNDNTYTGGTLVTGGTMTLSGAGRLSGTTGLTFSGGGLSIDNGPTVLGTIGTNQRINNTANPVSLNATSITLTGRTQGISSETLGSSVDLAGGLSNITMVAGASAGVQSNDLILPILTRSNTDAGLNLNGVLANIGSTGTGGRVIINSFGAGVTLINNVLPWAAFSGNDLVSYNSSFGLGILSEAGMAGYNQSLAAGGAITTTATQNIKATGDFNYNFVSGTSAINALVWNPATTVGRTLSFTTGTDKLFVTSGGIITSATVARNIGSALNNGSIAAGAAGAVGTQNLYFHATSAANVTVNSAIVDNSGTAATRLIFNLYNQAQVILADGTTTSFQPTVTTVLNSNIVTTASTGGLAVGQNISGPGIPAGATITAITLATLANDTTHFTISALAGAGAGTGTSTIGTVGLVTLPTFTPAASTTVTLPAGTTTAGLYVGMPITGAAFGVNNYITGITGTQTFTVAVAATATASTPVAGLTNATGNAYTGGTVLNGWTGNNGNANSGQIWANATNAIGSGGLIINNALVTAVQGGINPTNDVTLNMSAGLTLVGQNTLKSLTFNSNGFTSGASTNGPTVTIGTTTAGSVLFLTNPTVTATGNNGVRNGLITGIANSFLNFNGATAVFNVDGMKQNGKIVDPWFATLNVDTNIAIQNANGLTKNGDGVLQLSGPSTFTGGVNLTAGGLMIGGSSTPSLSNIPGVFNPVFTGPLGMGTLTIGGGTRILSSAAGNTVNNLVSVTGNFEFDGITNVTLNGFTSLGAATRSISVNTPQMTATLGGVVSGAGGIIKNGYGILVLGNDNAITGVTVNNGTLAGFQPIGASPSPSAPSPFGTGAVTYNGGILSVRTAGAAGTDGTDANFNNDVNVASALSYVNLDIQGNNTVTMGNLNLPVSGLLQPTVAQVNLTGVAGSALVFKTTSLGGNAIAGSLSRVTADAQTFNVGANATLILGGGGFARNNEPLNIGPGNLFLGGTNLFANGTAIANSLGGAAPTSNSSNAIYGAGQTVSLSGTNTYTILPQMGSSLIAGNNVGGLQQQSTLTPAQSLTTAVTWGLGVTASLNGVQPNDVLFDRAINITTSNQLGIYNGYLTITTAGSYNFIQGADDISSLVIDGVEIAREITSGKGIQDAARGGINLTSGVHSITTKINTGGGGGGTRLLYSGPDTAATAPNGGFQALPSGALSYFTGPANAGNNFYNAAQIDNDYVVSAAGNITLQALGSDFNTTIKSLTLGNGATIGATNDQAALIAVGGTGFIGVKGVTNVTAGGAIFNPTTANLYLIGGVNDGGVASTKIGAGTLSLNNSTLFTGAFAINVGTVVLREADGLSTGGNTVASGASLDVNGVTSSATRNLTINNVGTVSQVGAIYNSNVAAGGIAGTVTLATNSTINGFGEISLSGVVTSAAGITLTKFGPDTLTLGGNNTASLLGPIAITGGVLNNGALNAAVGQPLGANTISVAASTVLNLNGNSLAVGENVTLNATNLSNFGPNASTFGNLINSSVSNSVAVRNVVTAGNNMLQLANTANTATVNSTITLATGASAVGSNVLSTGGDIILAGVVSGAQGFLKRGGDTVFMRNASTYTGVTFVDAGILRIDGSGGIMGVGTGLITVQANNPIVNTALIIDNTSTVVQNRLNNGTAAPVAANQKALSLNGGVFTILGNASTAVTETVQVTPAANASGLLINQGQNYINLTNNGANVTLVSAGGSTTGVGLAAANGASVLITGKNLGNGVAAATNTNLLYSASSGNATIGSQGTAGLNNKAIIPWAIVDNTIVGTGTATGVSFATLDASVATVGLRPLALAEYATALTTNANVNLTSALTTQLAFANSNASINSLTFATVASGLTVAQGTTLNLQSGGVLATQTNTIAGPGIIASDTGAAITNYYFNTYGAGTILTVNAVIGSTQANTGRTGEILKAGAGTLILGGANFDISNTRVQEGTLMLGNASAIYFRVATAPTQTATGNSNNGPTLQVNGSGIVDLNGFNLAASNLASINPPGAQNSMTGGTIRNTGAGPRLLSLDTTTGNTWSGNISSGGGGINFAKYGNNTFTVTNSNTYTGTTIIGGGATTLADLGAFRGTSNVSINSATLIINDNGNQSDQFRLGAIPASVTFNGGGFQYNGRLGESTVTNIGAVSLASGASQFSTAAAAVGSATVVGTSFARSLGATVNFAGNVLGDDGNVRITGGVTNFNGIVGGWATSNAANPYNNPGAGDFVSHDPATGFRAIVDYKTTAGINYLGASVGVNQPAYGNTVFDTTGVAGAGKNVRVNTNGTVLLNSGNSTVNSMVIGSGGTTTLSFTIPTDTLFVQSGGILGTTDATTKNIGGATATTAILGPNLNGYITAGNSNGTAGAGNAGYELFLHNLSTTLAINSQIVNNGANAVSLVTSMGTQNGPIIRLNNTNTYTGTTTINSTDLRLNSLTGPAIAGSTTIIISSGTENAADSGRQANGRIFFELANQLNSGANVTLNSGTANLDLNNFNQTIASLTINNIGGNTTNSGGMGPNVRTGAGTLTLTGGITATNLLNTATMAFISGNVSIGAGQHTVQVDAGSAGADAQIGLAINGTFRGAGGIDKTGLGVLAVTGVEAYTGPTNVNLGTLVLGGFDNAGTPGRITAQIVNSQVTVAAGATVDMRGGNGIIGSLNGAGSVTNSMFAVTSNGSAGNVGTLIIGTDNTVTGNFSGTFTNFINGANQATGFGLNVTKLGTGTQLVSGDNALAQSSGNGNINNVGTLDLQGGILRVSGANGSLGFTAINVKAGTTLAIDNSVNNKANRLGGAALSGAIVINGATQTTTGANSTFTTTPAIAATLFVGSTVFGPGLPASLITAINTVSGLITTNGTSSQTLAATGETFYISAPRTMLMQGGTILFQEGAALINEGGALANGVGNVTLNNGSSVWNFDITAGTAGASVSVNALSGGSGSLLLNAGGSQTLGRALAGASSVNVYVNAGMNSQGSGTISTGAAINAVAALSGGNFSGVGVRADVTGIDSTSNTGFVTYDTFGYRLLAQTTGTGSEYRVFPAQPLFPTFAAVSLAGTVNALVTSATPIALTANTTVNSIRFDGAGGGIVSQGGNIAPANSSPQLFNALGTLNTLTVTTGGIIANATTNLTGGAVSAGGSAIRLTNSGTVNSSAYLISTNVADSFIKDGAGTVNLGARLLQGNSGDAGATVVNGGRVNLTSGANTLTVINNGAVSFVDNLTVNGTGIVDLSGFDQTVANIVSTDIAPGGGGTITNTGALANLNANANSTFGGSINGAINFYKTGANNLTLTSSNGYTGLTQVQGGILVLQDSGTITGSTVFNLNGGELRFDNRNNSLSDINPRLTLGSTATINLNSGILTDFGGANGNITNTYGTLNVLQGQNQIRQDAIPSLSNRTTAFTTFNAPSAASGATVHFNSGNGTPGGTGTVPNIVLPNTINATASSVVTGISIIPLSNTTGLTVSQSVTGAGITPGSYITAINPGVSITISAATTGSTPTTLAFGPATINPTPTTTGGGIIPWAVVLTDQPAMWNPLINPITGLAYGVTIPGNAGVNAAGLSFTTLGYQATQINAATTGQNVNQGTGTITELANQLTRTFNSFRFSSGTATTLTLSQPGNELVRLESGVLITNNSTLPITNGRLTAGPATNTAATLYSWAVSQTTLNLQLVDNGTGALTLSKNGGSTLSLVPQLSPALSTAGFATNATIAGSTTVTIAAAPTTPVAIGDAVYGPGVPNGATVSALISTTSFTISAPAFATTNAGTLGFGTSQVISAGISSVATALLNPTIPMTNTAGLYVGETITGTGIPTGATISAISTNTSITIVGTTTAATGTTLGFNAANVSTNNAYTGNTIVNSGVLAMNGAVGSRSLNAGLLTINNSGSVTMTNAGQIAPTSNLTINGGGVLTFAPVTLASPTTGGINALNSVTFNNNGGTATPTLAGGTNGIVTVKNGLITSNSDNQGTAPTVSGVLNFGQIALGTSASASNLVTVADVGGFVAGQTVVGINIPAATTISSISGNVLTLSNPVTTGATGAISTVNQAAGATTAIAPTLNVTTTNLNELSADLIISAIIANSTVGGAGLGGWSNLINGGAALQKTGNGILVLSGLNTFDNGLNLTLGTLVLGQSTNVTTLTGGVATAFANGPMGTGALTIGGGTTVMSDSTLRTINNNVVVGGNFTFGGRMTGNGVTINGTTGLGTGVKNITVTNPQTTATLAGVVSNTSGGLTKSGDGILALTATLPNTYVGTTSVLGGLLAISGNAAALGATTNNLVVGANGTLSINGVSITVDGINGDPTNSTATATAGGLITNIGAAGTLTLGSANNALATFSGTITNAASALAVTKLGTGRQNLLGQNTYQGITTISNGTLGVNTLTREAGLQTGSTTTNFTTAAIPTGALGSQTITLTAADFANLIAAGAGVGSGVQATGTGATPIITNIDSVNFTITLSVANTAAITSTLVAQTNTVTVTAAVAAQLAAGMVITGAGIQVGTTVTSVVGTTVTLSQPAILAIVAAGTQTYSTPSSVGTSSNANASLLIGSATAATLDYIGTGNTTDRGFTMGAGGATVNANGTGALVFTSFTAPVNTIANAGNATLTLGGANTANNTFGQIIPGTGAGGSPVGTSLIKADAGRWVLTQANTYSGATAVNLGTLSIANNLALGAATGVAATGTVVANGATLGLQNNITVGNEKLDINGAGATGVLGALRNESGSNAYGGLITVVTNATIAAAGGSTLTLNGNVDKNGTTLTLAGAGSMIINGQITGASANSDLVVDGGSRTLNNTNTYNGPTTIINGGTLNANAAGALPTSPRSAVTLDNTGSGSSTLALTGGFSQVAASLTSPVASSVVNLNANTLTVGAASGSTTFAGAIGGAGGNLIKDLASTQVLSGSNGYTGTTAVNGGTLTVSGSLSGTSGVTVSTGGTLLLNSSTAANNIINPAATLTGSGGSVVLDNSQTGRTNTFATLTLTANSTLDFGTNNTNTYLFTAAASPLTLSGFTLNVMGWTGNAYDISEVADHGPASQDRLLFNTDPGFALNTVISGISFFNDGGAFIGNGLAVSFGSQFEIVAVPEPATTALIGAVALCALIGYRERRRFTGIRSRMVRK